MELKGFLETSFVDWPGKICSVLFTPGCNFRCPFCHNHGLILAPDEYETIPAEYIFKRLDAFRGWIDGVCVTGGEPTLHKGLKDLIVEIKRRGFAVKLDTNGARPDVLSGFLEEGLLDYIAMDVKGPLNHIEYSRAAGVPVDIMLIERSIALLKRGAIPYEFRTTVVPALHGAVELSVMAEQLCGARIWRLQNFQPANALDHEFRQNEAYDENQMEELRGLAREKISSVL